MSNLLDEKEYKHKFIDKDVFYWLRWVFFIPIACLASQFIPWIERLFQYIFSYNHFDHTIQIILLSLSCFVFMAIAKFMAPSNKKIVGLIILIIIAAAVILFILRFASLSPIIKSDDIVKEYYGILKDTIPLYIAMLLTHIFYKGETFLGLSSDF